MSRRLARERVFQLVFEYGFYGVPNPDTLETICAGFGDDDREYVCKVYYGVIEEYDSLRALISKFVKGNSPSEKFHRTDFYILLIAAYELVHRIAPDATVISEAVYLAKRFGVAQSGRLVNGVLASVLKELRAPAETGSASAEKGEQSGDTPAETKSEEDAPKDDTRKDEQ